MNKHMTFKFEYEAQSNLFWVFKVLFKITKVREFYWPGLGEYDKGVEWLEKADSIPLAPSHFRDGIKVCRHPLLLQKGGGAFSDDLHGKFISGMLKSLL